LANVQHIQQESMTFIQLALRRQRRWMMLSNVSLVQLFHRTSAH